jgi:BMFP domain-containing protein YqiC
MMRQFLPVVVPGFLLGPLAERHV